jgi:guanylate kinase
MKHICLLVGPSGSGKTTIAEALSELYGYDIISSYTDRPPRYPGEKGHLFVTEEEYLKIPDMVAETVFDGHHYGVPAKLLEENDIYIVDPCGVRTMLANYHGSKTPLVFVVWVSEEERRKRMLARGDTEEMVERRLKTDREQFKLDELMGMSDYLITNKSIEHAVALVHAALTGVELTKA